MTSKIPINCGHCGAFFYRKGRGGREKHCSEKCRFWSKVTISENCFNWNGGVFTKTGYGQFAITSKKPDVAHRVSWRLTFGEIPDETQVLHRCDNRLCVKPEHLFLGTQSDNMSDMAVKGRHVGTRGKKFSADVCAQKSVQMRKIWAERKAA